MREETRDFFQRRFGHDFGAVRLHTDESADAAARSLSARAFTYGNHIAFRRGSYSESTFEGRRLLAHELTHTIQQRVSPRSQVSLYVFSRPQDESSDSAT